MSAEDFQTSFIDAPTGDSVTVRTDATVIKPILNPIDKLVDEARLTFDEDGLQVKVVDPANVGLLTLSVRPAAFEQYDLGTEDGAAMTVGLNLDTLLKYVRSARMSGSHCDPVLLEFNRTAATVTITREYDTTTVTRRDEFLTLDPDSVRAMGDIPDLGLPWRATVDTDALNDVVPDVNASSDYARLAERNGQFHITGTAKKDDKIAKATTADFGDVAEPTEEHTDAADGAASKLSLDYLKDVATGVKQAKADQVTIEWGEEFPVIFGFSRSLDDEVVVEGQYMVAPRIEGDS